jgi:hypothetical protein
MFTKEILMELFKKNEKRNFQIYTNIAFGRGINGVSYRSFVGEIYLDDNRRNIGNICSIKGFGKTYLVIEYKGEKWNSSYYCDAPKEIYVPYDAIVMVDFITDESHKLYGFTGKHNFTEL